MPNPNRDPPIPVAEFARELLDGFQGHADGCAALASTAYHGSLASALNKSDLKERASFWREAVKELRDLAALHGVEMEDGT